MAFFGSYYFLLKEYAFYTQYAIILEVNTEVKTPLGIKTPLAFSKSDTYMFHKAFEKSLKMNKPYSRF